MFCEAALVVEGCAQLVWILVLRYLESAADDKALEDFSLFRGGGLLRDMSTLNVAQSHLWGPAFEGILYGLYMSLAMAFVSMPISTAQSHVQHRTQLYSQ